MAVEAWELPRQANGLDYGVNHTWVEGRVGAVRFKERSAPSQSGLQVLS